MHLESAHSVESWVGRSICGEEDTKLCIQRLACKDLNVFYVYIKISGMRKYNITGVGSFSVVSNLSLQVSIHFAKSLFKIYKICALFHVFILFRCVDRFQVFSPHYFPIGFQRLLYPLTRFTFSHVFVVWIFHKHKMLANLIKCSSIFWQIVVKCCKLLAKMCEMSAKFRPASAQIRQIVIVCSYIQFHIFSDLTSLFT